MDNMTDTQPVDIRDIPGNLPWHIESNIDWDGVASDLKQDYTCVELDGDTWYYLA